MSRISSLTGVIFYRVFDVESGECLHTLLGHTAEIVSLNFDTNGQRIMTGSFDHTVKGMPLRVKLECCSVCAAVLLSAYFDHTQNHRFAGGVRVLIRLRLFFCILCAVL